MLCGRTSVGLSLAVTTAASTSHGKGTAAKVPKVALRYEVIIDGS